MTAPVDDRERLERLFQNQAAVGLHHGAQLAVYHEGEQVVDLTAGTAGPDGEPVQSDQGFVFFSSTKPLAGACVHRLVEAGDLDYDEPVATYWPEFTRGDPAKEQVTVRHVLSHQGGFPAGEFDLRPDDWTDWDAAVEAMEEIELQFEPGSTAAYHAMNYGWVVGELVRRVTGETAGSYLREHVLDPLGMDDTHLGLPASEPDDVATLVGFEAFDRCRERAGGLGADNADAAANFNREAFHRAEMPAASGVGTASDLARFYACLGNGGELDGVRLLSEATVAEATSLQIAVDHDRTLGTPVRYGLGFFLAGTPFDSYGTLAPPSTFGHGGLGSSVAWADPERDLAFAVVTNGVRDSYEHRVRVNELGTAVRRVFG
ncbi:MAG: serine hydrolase domain-containing protein [Haloarculaceae archaeon]